MPVTAAPRTVYIFAGCVCSGIFWMLDYFVVGIIANSGTSIHVITAGGDTGALAARGTFAVGITTSCAVTGAGAGAAGSSAATLSVAICAGAGATKWQLRSSTVSELPADVTVNSIVSHAEPAGLLTSK